MKTEKAMFGAGCFWGVQYYFDQVPGVISSSVGYSGGHTENPSYEDVCTRTTGHAEVVELEFDPAKVSYKTLLQHFFRLHDPTQLNRQGPDVGDNYRSVIFYYDDNQKAQAETEKEKAQKKFDKRVVTEISPSKEFYPAEDYHQKFTERTGHGFCAADYSPIK